MGADKTPPSQFLPRLNRTLSTTTATTLSTHLLTLGQLFQPPVHGASEEVVVNSGAGYLTKAQLNGKTEEEQAAEDEEEEEEEEEVDKFEHKFARGWVERIVQSGGEWCEDAPTVEERSGREEVVEAAAALLAVWSGTSASGAILREIALPHEVNVIVNDAPYVSSSHDSVGVQTWGSSILLARRILNFPEYFLPTPNGQRPLRILELGAGTGVVSLALVKSPLNVLRGVSVDATDYHPDVLSNLCKNAALNLPTDDDDSLPPGTTRFTSPASSGSLLVRPLDWLSYVRTGPMITRGRDGLRDRSASPSLVSSSSDRDDDGRFDVVIAADCVYECHHAGWIKETVKALLRLPSEFDPTDQGGVFHCFMPLRPTHVKEVESVQLAFPLESPPPPTTSYFPAFPADSNSLLVPTASDDVATRPLSPSLLVPPTSSRTATDKWVLRTLETQDFKAGLERGVGRRDEMGYRRFKIGWVSIEVDAHVGVGAR